MFTSPIGFEKLTQTQQSDNAIEYAKAGDLVKLLQLPHSAYVKSGYPEQGQPHTALDAACLGKQKTLIPWLCTQIPEDDIQSALYFAIASGDEEVILILAQSCNIDLIAHHPDEISALPESNPLASYYFAFDELGKTNKKLKDALVIAITKLNDNKKADRPLDLDEFQELMTRSKYNVTLTAFLSMLHTVYRSYNQSLANKPNTQLVTL